MGSCGGFPRLLCCLKRHIVGVVAEVIADVIASPSGDVPPQMPTGRPFAVLGNFIGYFNGIKQFLIPNIEGDAPP